MPVSLSRAAGRPDYGSDAAWRMACAGALRRPRIGSARWLPSNRPESLRLSASAPVRTPGTAPWHRLRVAPPGGRAVGLIRVRVASAHCSCIPLWPGVAPNETNVPKTPPETRTPDDGEGCGPGRDAPCDHVRDVSVPTLTPFLVSNGTGAAIIIAPGGGYHDLAFGKEGIDVARMCTAIYAARSPSCLSI